MRRFLLRSVEQSFPGSTVERFRLASRTRHFVVSLAFTIAFLPPLAQAQRGGGMAGHAVSAPAAAPHFAMRAAPAPISHVSAAAHAPAAAHYVRTRSGAAMSRPNNGRSFASGSRFNGTRHVRSSDVPGLGFDYPHLAAVGGGRDHGRGFGRDRNRPSLAYFPFFGGGYYLPLYDEYDDTPPADEQQAESVEPDYYPGNYPPPPRPGDNAQGFPAPAPAPTSAAAASPERPADEYVFVRRDGSLFFAVAYTWDAGNLRYVTNEGLRRSIAGDTLDLDATQQFNEQRGLNFHVPSA